MNQLRALSFAIVAATILLSFGCQMEPSPDPAALATEVDRLADLYLERQMEHMPERGYIMGVPPERHDGLFDNSVMAYERARREEDEMIAELDLVPADALTDTPQWVTAGLLREALEASRGLRVCRRELWNVNHFEGWQAYYPTLAEMQPVGTPELREQALARWRKLPTLIDNEVANLRRGLEAGYTANRAVTARVIVQIDRLLAVPVEESPFMSPALRDETPEFVEEFRTLVALEIVPAAKRYRDFLNDTYLDQARESLAVADNPNGHACYAAMLRFHTTLDRTAEEVFELGSRTVQRNRQEVIELGRERYGTDDFAEIVRRAQADPSDTFVDRDEVFSFARDAVERSMTVLDGWFGLKPEHECIVKPHPEYQEGTGIGPRYEVGDGERPGIYRITLSNPEAQSKGRSEVVAFHEAYPGHHLQLTVAQELEGLHPMSQVAWYTSYGEGWARYAEALAEEADLYSSPVALILRRAWPARGMVVDPGIHVMGWSREQAREFMIVSGSVPEEEADDMVDRIAIWPGQLTAYDSGGLEIFALRRKAEEAFGEDFDIREFHDRVLENGAVPLWMLRRHVEAWIESR
ncbi:MAG: DUF885 domain-containing protein [Acidobacteriota bacterium]